LKAELKVVVREKETVSEQKMQLAIENSKLKTQIERFKTKLNQNNAQIAGIS